MSFSGLLFIFFRILEIVTLIPALGMLGWFVHLYTSRNILTPDFIVVLFVVSVLGAAWAIATTVAYFRARHSALFVAFVDLCFVGAFIAGVYLLRGIADADCTNVTTGSYYANVGSVHFWYQGSGSAFSVSINKTCAMLKASFAFGIMNCIFFFITCLLALLVHRHYGEDRVYREKHVTRTSHRRHSGSPRRSHHSHRSYRY